MRNNFKFLQIVDAIGRVDGRANLVGIAVETSLPRSTRGTDYFCLVRIVDDSWPNGIRINFFAETMTELPLIHNVGDVVVVTNVMIKSVNQEVQEVNAVYYKNSSSFALFQSTGDFVPFQRSRLYNYMYTDKRLIYVLRKWSLDNKIEGMHKSLFLRDTGNIESINTVCKILHVVQFDNGEWMIFIWNGTDAIPHPIEARLEDEEQNHLPLTLDSIPLSRDILSTFPTVGTVMRMTVDQSYANIGIQFLQTNRWVKLIDVKFEIHASLWRAVLTPLTKICYLLEDDECVLQHKRMYEERTRLKWGKMPFTSHPWPSSLTEIDRPNAPFVTLMDVLTYPEVTCKYKCVVRVVAMHPCSVDDFRNTRGIYQVRVTLEDPTARLHAFILGENGVKFFGNYVTTDMLIRKRNKLLGIGDEDEASSSTSSRNPPWIQCCLISHYIDASDVWGSRVYQIVGTHVRLDF